MEKKLMSSIIESWVISEVRKGTKDRDKRTQTAWKDKEEESRDI